MNFDKKRRARVQGGWAAPNVNKSGRANSSLASGKSYTHQTDQNTDSKDTSLNDTNQLQSHARIHSARSDKERTKAQGLPNWVGRNIDQQAPKKKFVYEEPNEVSSNSLRLPKLFNIKTLL